MMHLLIARRVIELTTESSLESSVGL
jgi:hypothetical protein